VQWICLRGPVACLLVWKNISMWSG
jgi:hypothetical protein